MSSDHRLTPQKKIWEKIGWGFIESPHLI